MSLPDTAELDREIAALKRRMAHLNDLVIRSPASEEGQEANHAFNLADSRLKDLRERRAHVLAGNPDPASVVAATKVAPKPAVQMPHRMTGKSPTDGRNVTIEHPLDNKLDEFASIFRKHADRSMEVIEDDIHETVDWFCNQKINSEKLFSQAMYVAFCETMARLNAEISAVAEFQMNRRREIEARLDALEQRPGLKYRGVYSPTEKYVVGDFVSFRGSLWHANLVTTGVQPGDGQIWRLAVKHGRDAKERAAQ